MKLKDIMEMEHEEENDDTTFPEWLRLQYEKRADDERQGGGSIEINTSANYVAVTMSDGSEYMFQGHEADQMLSEVPPNINPEDFILAIAQNW